MGYLPAIIALLAAVAGWHYLFYSRAAQGLDGVESSAANQRRSRLRRINATALLLLAAGFYAGFQVDPHRHALIFLGLWTGVLVLLVMVIVLAVVDLWLTSRIRRKS
jgi:high-affinity Fe2+/Pb2+ permease